MFLDSIDGSLVFWRPRAHSIVITGLRAFCEAVEIHELIPVLRLCWRESVNVRVFVPASAFADLRVRVFVCVLVCFCLSGWLFSA